jgi:hypothetical protein
MSLPTIPHATVILNQYGRINFAMDEGYVFYKLSDYEGLIDDEGNPREPCPEEISYSRAGYSFPLNYDFSTIIVVAEADAPADQIFGTIIPPTVIQ